VTGEKSLHRPAVLIYQELGEIPFDPPPE